MSWYPDVGFGSKLLDLLGQNVSCGIVFSKCAVGEIGTQPVRKAKKQGVSAHSVSLDLMLPIFFNLDLK
jgi:hypothetical protein